MKGGSATSQGMRWTLFREKYEERSICSIKESMRIMRFRSTSLFTRSAVIALIAASFILVPPATGAGAAGHSATGKYLVAFQSEPSSGWVTRDFNPFVSAPNDFTKGGIYEPLMVITQAGGGRTYPWLATSYKWGKG